MCTTCGCSDTEHVMITDPVTGERTVLADHDHGHPHAHGDHQHDHDHDHDQASLHAGVHGRVVQLERDLLAKNQLIAERSRGWFEGREILAVNLMSSPGAGKTTLLERTIGVVSQSAPVYVVEGDQATLNDAERIKAAGAPVVQINTGTGCHLDADMVARGMTELKPPHGAVVFIENVGNLICPALFDLGERAKVVILSVTEGEDKPIKYPHMFRACQLMLINKTDLLPHLRFSVERCIGYAREINPGIRVITVSAETGDGIDAWFAWLDAERRALSL
ncbi:hydrogenase nickel incorporation protein HypB [Rhodopila sp.]|uniref:hydrogenase nickel incorporation protein HypB n=1 Tax=Rhodopila sp. TaxID=2480087 RepID=UPI003D0D1607